MYNTPFPDRADLPSSGRLIRSTIVAGVSAVAVLITIVLPSEYGIDPTRVGSMLGLTPMGEIKMQLAAEARADLQFAQPETSAGTTTISTSSIPSGPTTAELVNRIEVLEALVSAVPAQRVLEPSPSPQTQPGLAMPAPLEASIETEGESLWRDEVSFVLTPGQGSEYKLVMAAGAVATFEFIADGGVINFDHHGEGQGQSFSYEEGRGVNMDNGEIVAPVEGTHGWFFRNRGSSDVVVTLRTGGNYFELRKLV